METLVNKLKQRAIDDLRKSPDAPFIASSAGSWTKHQLADEIEKNTEMGVDTLTHLVTLTIDLVSRGKRKLEPAPWIKWRDGQQYLFGEVGKLTLFYIKDRGANSGLERYELEVKFLDRRWTSDNVDELKSVAEEQLHTLLTEIVK